MAGITGTLQSGDGCRVGQMLDSIVHRGTYKREIFETDNATIGMVWSKQEDDKLKAQQSSLIFTDGPGNGQEARVARIRNHWEFSRDELGAVPLYTAYDDDGTLLFASEVKALLPLAKEILEVPPGHTLSASGLRRNFEIVKKHSLKTDPLILAIKLRSKLFASIIRRISSNPVGAWLSGGMDSSTIAALAISYVDKLHTFSIGLKEAPDLKYARIAADHLGSVHHEVIISTEDLFQVLPDVIYHLESFDALLVRSSIANYLLARETADYVSEVFSGEGGDELFGGYEYLRSIPLSKLDDELISITSQLHNTAFQRVDRMAAAFGLTPHMIFADPEVVDFAMKIPARMKIQNGIEKWILRRSMTGLLPEVILNRRKSKFWEGTSVGTRISEYASRKITDHDFAAERKLNNGWLLNSKEELMYYRIFSDLFREPGDLRWMGRTPQNSEN